MKVPFYKSQNLSSRNPFSLGRSRAHKVCMWVPWNIMFLFLTLIITVYKIKNMPALPSSLVTSLLYGFSLLLTLPTGEHCLDLCCDIYCYDDELWRRRRSWKKTGRQINSHDIILTSKFDKVLRLRDFQRMGKGWSVQIFDEASLRVKLPPQICPHGKFISKLFRQDLPWERNLSVSRPLVVG